MIFLNFKTYKESSLDNADRLAAYLNDIQLRYPVMTIACPQNTDIPSVSEILPGHTWMQHSDWQKMGRATGWQLPELAKMHGARGTLLNHSEHKLSFEVLTATMKRCREVGFQTLIFAEDVEEAKKVATLKPDYIGYEPPELIASKDTSVARAKPEIIKEVVLAVSPIPVIVGAGVKDQEDVRVSLTLGAKGVALASAVILSSDPKGVLEDLAKGFESI